MNKKGKKQKSAFRLDLIAVVLFAAISLLILVFLPNSPLSHGWNPVEPLSVTDEVTPLTRWKLARATAQPEVCLEALQEVASFAPSDPPASTNPACFIETPVTLSRVGNARVNGLQTDCASALRLAMWEHHGLQPAARRQFGADVAVINDIGSYNCRAMRTSSGDSTRMSAHATARAIDVTGFQFTDGTRISLINDWDQGGAVSAFFRDVQETSCSFFPQSLSPYYNELHADHFHLQASGWRVCR